MKKTLLFTALFFLNALYSQSFIPVYQTRANAVTQANINTNLLEFATFGVKNSGSAANNNAFNWLKSKYESFGYTASQMETDPFSFNNRNTQNLIVTKTGTLYPNTYVIICGHYDTIAGPGVNDNGSGVSTILEVARILKDVPTEYSIKFINFSGEEQGLYGSQHYVNNVANATVPKMDIKVVFNIDQVGGVAGQVNNKIRCDVDSYAPSFNNAASQMMANQLAQVTTLYTSLQTSFYGAFSSDYVPFHEDGYVVTGFYEFNESSKPHTPNDTYVNMDPVFVYNVARAAVGAVQHFAVASTLNLGVTDCPPEKQLESLQIYPNPAKDFIHIDMINQGLTKYSFAITDATGRIVSQTKNESKINVSALSSGIYFGTLSIGDLKITKKISIVK